MKNTLWKLMAILVVVVMLAGGLAACGPTPEPQIVKETVVVTEKETVVVTEKEQVEVEVTKIVTEEKEVEKVVTATPEPMRKILTAAWVQEPDTLNPYYTNMWFSSILQQLYNCWAWEYDDENVPFPRLVTEIPTADNGGVSEDGTVLTLNLRDDLVWSDGTPLTAEDFVFTYEMIVNPGNTVASVYPYDALDSVEATDERTVVMTFSEPFMPWEASLWHGILPKHVLGPVFESDGSIDEADWNIVANVSCGPYEVAEWESGSYLRFITNENYWLGQPSIEEIYFQFVPDYAAQTAAIIAGDADLGTFPPISDIPTLQAAGVTVVSQNGGYNEGWFFNFREMASPGARDLKVRQAVTMAIDREAIINDLQAGLTVPAETLWDGIAGQGWVSPDIVPWTYDPEGAKALLDDAGYIDSDGDGIREDADGNPLTLKHGTTIREVRQDIQAVAQQMLREVGINLEINSWDSDFFFGSYTDGSPAMLGEVDIQEWSDTTGSFPDPDHYYWLCSELPDEENPWGTNSFGCDETLDAMLQEQSTMLDLEERKAKIQEITKYIHDNVYWFGIYVDPDYWMIGDRVTGYKFSGVTPFYNIMEWDMQ